MVIFVICMVNALFKRAAQAYAMMEGRAYVMADDIQAVFVAVASHRLNTSEAETLQCLQRVVVA